MRTIIWFALTIFMSCVGIPQIWAQSNGKTGNMAIDIEVIGFDIKADRVDPKHPGEAVANITVSNCTMLHGNGLSIGSETLGGVKNVAVENITFQDSLNGIRIKSPRGKGGEVANISYRNIKLNEVNSPLVFAAYYAGQRGPAGVF